MVKQFTVRIVQNRPLSCTTYSCINYVHFFLLIIMAFLPQQDSFHVCDQRILREVSKRHQDYSVFRKIIKSGFRKFHHGGVYTVYMYVVKWKYLRRQCYRRAICNDNFKLNKLPQQILFKMFTKPVLHKYMRLAACMVYSTVCLL